LRCITGLDGVAQPGWLGFTRTFHQRRTIQQLAVGTSIPVTFFFFDLPFQWKKTPHPQHIRGLTFSASAQDGQLLRQPTSLSASTARGFAMLAADRLLVGHVPLPYDFRARGNMITFRTPDGSTGKAENQGATPSISTCSWSRVVET
jgi:hypothetical protein